MPGEREYYDKTLSSCAGIRMFCPREDTVRNYAYYPILITDEYPITRDELYDKLRANNIYTRKYFYPITSDQACFKNKYKNCKLNVARTLSDHVLMLPIYESMSLEDQDRIISLIL